MNSEWAAENLQTIRTLMERSAVYRRALAPVMTFTGSVGVAAGGVAWKLGITALPQFAVYWMLVSLVAIGGDFFLVRRQALKDREPFWSPPTRRVTQAVVPALFVGLACGVFFIGWLRYSPLAVLLAVVWILLYGCALHAAGFFMPRGIRLFAWAFILGGCGLLGAFAFWPGAPPRPELGNAVMGLFFGALQLAYGVYLYFTEQRPDEA